MVEILLREKTLDFKRSIELFLLVELIASRGGERESGIFFILGRWTGIIASITNKCKTKLDRWVFTTINLCILWYFSWALTTLPPIIATLSFSMRFDQRWSYSLPNLEVDMVRAQNVYHVAMSSQRGGPDGKALK
ncbi:hypothetical protein F4703DRAFT_1919038 [Phycomyces blakesleeanus]